MLSARVRALRHVVIAARRKETMEACIGGVVVNARLRDRKQHVRGELERQQRVEAASNEPQFGAAVNFCAAIVPREPLLAAIGRLEARHADVAHAFRRHMGQVLLEHHARLGDFAGVDPADDGLELGPVVRDRLAQPRPALGELDPNRPLLKKDATRVEGVLGREGAEPGQHGIRDEPGKRGRPALWRTGAIIDQRMRYRFPGGKRSRNNAAEQVMRTFDTKPRGRGARQGIARDEIRRLVVTSGGIVFSGELEPRQRCEAAGDFGPRGCIVPVRGAFVANIAGHDFPLGLPPLPQHRISRHVRRLFRVLVRLPTRKEDAG